MKKINLAVIFGGKSGEHEVSLSSARAVMNALSKDKYNIIPIAITKNGNWLVGDKGRRYMELNKQSAGKEGAITLEKSQELVQAEQENGLQNYAEGEIKGKVDIILPILHGPYGEDGRLQGMLDMLGLPYVFSGVLAHALGMNKSKAKIIVENAGVPVLDEVILEKNEKPDLDAIINKLSLPVVVKPLELGSSVGVSIARTKQQLDKSIAESFRHDRKAIVEKYVKGREFTVTVMGNGRKTRVIGATEIIPKISEFYDFKAKYEEGGSEHICPADISEEMTSKVSRYAETVFKSIGCKDLARADFMLDENGEFYFIDLNTIPGMTPTSLAPQAAKAAGMEFSEFLDKLIEGAMTHGNNN